MRKVLGICTCFNRKEKTLRAISSLKNNSETEFHFIVVDDCSKDGTAEAVGVDSAVTVINGTGNLFYSGGMNKGMTVAKELISKGAQYDYVLLYNDDVNFYPNSIFKMIESVEAIDADGCTAVAGSTVDNEGNYTYGGIVKLSNWKPNCKHVMSDGKLEECDTCNGNCMLLPVNVFMSVPAMDDFYVHSLGDYDYGFSVTQKGFKIIATNFYVGECEYDHEVKGSWQDMSLPFLKRLKLKESLHGNPTKYWCYYLRKNYGLFPAIVYTCTDILHLIIPRK